MAGRRRRPASLSEEGLDDTILERVESDQDEATGGFENAFGAGKPARQFQKLVVDENPKRLEGASSRMDRAFARMHHASDDIRERARCRNRLRFACLGDGTRNRARVMLFAERTDDSGKITFAGAGNYVGHARTIAAHAHVQRSVEPERKSARCLVKLHGRNAEVEHHAVNRSDAAAFDDCFEIGKAIFDQLQPAIRCADERRASCDSVLIAINADHPRTGRRKDYAGIATGAKRCVDVNAAVMHAEQFDRPASEHRNVTSQSASDSVAVAARHHSRAPGGFCSAVPVPNCSLKARTLSVASVSSARNRPGSQMRNLWPRPTNTAASVIPAWLL